MPDIRPGQLQICPVCEQPVDEDQQAAEAQEISFLGASAYAWCPNCSRQVPRPWDAAYKARWSEAFTARCQARDPEPERREELWVMTGPAGVVVKATLHHDASRVVLRWWEDDDLQGREAFGSRESAVLRAEELKERLLERGFEVSALARR